MGRLLLTALRTGFLVGAVLFTLAGRSALADTVIFVTNEPGGQILRVDVTTNTITTVLTVSANPDTLVFRGANNILFTEVLQGTLADFNTLTSTVTNIATGFAQPRDVILEPGGGSALVADFFGGTGNGTIDQVNLTTDAVTTLFTATTTAGIDGLAFDSKGDLFAVLGRNEIAQIDPTTGAILNQTATFDGNLDGLTFDSSTGELWVGSENGFIWEVPTSLASETSFAAGAIDGLEADGKGNLFLANFMNNIQEFNIPTSTLTNLTTVSGIDDLAPLTGAGAPTPEPGTLILFGSGLMGLAGAIRGRKHA